VKRREAPGERLHPVRVESPEVTGLLQLKQEHPELGDAADMQLALLELQRRIQARIPTARTPSSESALTEQLRRGDRLLDLADLPLDWSDVRLVLRQAADILRRYEALDDDGHRAITAVLREGDRVETLIRDWYAETATPSRARGRAADRHREGLPAVIDDVLALALRPFLARAVESYGMEIDLAAWGRGWCPYCGGAPELAVLQSADQRLLVCGRCAGRWEWFTVGCPWCNERDKERLSAFASRDRRYRVYACNSCRKYLKGFDASVGGRPVLPALDAIATLPLDAAAVQQGYRADGEAD
jgi:hypothetical protein